MLKKIFNFLYIRLVGQARYAKRIGVQFGENCSFHGLSKFGSEPYLIKLGNSVRLVSVNFVNHDGGVWVLRKKHPKIDIIGKIIVGNNVFIGQESTLLPGTHIGDNVVIGARSLVKGELEGGFVYAGVPAKKICSIEEYETKALLHGFHTKSMNRNEKEVFLRRKLF